MIKQSHGVDQAISQDRQQMREYRTEATRREESESIAAQADPLMIAEEGTAEQLARVEVREEGEARDRTAGEVLLRSPPDGLACFRLRNFFFPPTDNQSTLDFGQRPTFFPRSFYHLLHAGTLKPFF